MHLSVDIQGGKGQLEAKREEEVRVQIKILEGGVSLEY